jgi:hypothetical protein
MELSKQQQHQQQRSSDSLQRTQKPQPQRERQGLGVIKPGVNPGAKLDFSFLVNLSPKF